MIMKKYNRFFFTNIWHNVIKTYHKHIILEYARPFCGAT